MVQTWANRHIKDGTKPSFDDIYKLLGEMALVSEELLHKNSYQSNKLG
jgi:hypothetical protein